jgi:hypothetical protein
MRCPGVHTNSRSGERLETNRGRGENPWTMKFSDKDRGTVYPLCSLAITGVEKEKEEGDRRQEASTWRS